MNAFVCSDLHVSYKNLNQIENFLVGNKEIGVIIFAGDALNMGEPIGFVEILIKTISRIGLPFMWVPGNNDFGRGYHKLNAKIKSLEGRIVQFGGYRFTGVGGSPASWSGQYAGSKMIEKEKIAGTIFVSHVPPPGILVMQKSDPDPLSQEKNSVYSPISQSVISTHPEPAVGRIEGGEKSCHNGNNVSGRKFSDSPRVHICGHQHSRWGCGYLGSTKVINPGPAELGHYAIMNLDSLAVEFCRFKKGIL